MLLLTALASLAETQCVLTSLHAALRARRQHPVALGCGRHPAHMKACILHSGNSDLYQTGVAGHACHGRIVRRATTCVRVTSACPGAL
jgi:hypothetical protein